MKTWSTAIITTIPENIIHMFFGSQAPGVGVLASKIVNRTALAALTCLFGIVGGVVGCAAGALIGQANEIGWASGAKLGALNGARLSMEMLESTAASGQWFLFGVFWSLVNGKVFQEWLGEALLVDEDQHQGGAVRREWGNEFGMGRSRGLPADWINELPEFLIGLQGKIKISEEDCNCSICLQGFAEGDTARFLPKCGHHFHKSCIGRWLTYGGSCPVCRQDVR